MRSGDEVGCERSRTGESPKGVSQPWVQGEQLVHGSPFCGLPARVGKGHSVGRAEFPGSECKGLMLA